MNERTYIVDIGLTMHKGDDGSKPRNDKQELHCKCGFVHLYNGKVKRNVVINKQGAFQDSHSLESVQCPNCKTTYPEKYTKKPIILTPNGNVMISTNYRCVDIELGGEIISYLLKERKYALYNQREHKIEVKSATDFLEFNKNTGRTKLFIDNSHLRDVRHLRSKAYDINTKQFETDVYFEPSISNFTMLTQFFGYSPNIEFEGLENTFHFFNNLSEHWPDYDEIIKLPVFNQLLESYKIYSKTINENGESKEIQYQLLPDSYGGDELEEVEVNPGEYLALINDFAVYFIAAISYSNITTIFLTKGISFFNNFIQSEFICHPNVYRAHKATYPAKIMEVSVNFTQNGVAKGKGYLQISSILLKNISDMPDIKYLYLFNELDLITKTELENLFINHEKDSVWGVIAVLTSYGNSVMGKLNIRHIEHIIKHRLYENYSNDFMTEYLDTIKTINLIIENQPKVKRLIENNKQRLSASEIQGYYDYINVKENLIFEAKTARKLKAIHDNLSALHATFQDSVEAEKYFTVVQPLFEEYNEEIDDVSFTIIPSAMELHKEHLLMSHCINTYLKQINELSYLAIHVEHTISKERATLGLRRSGDKLFFDQLKGYKNSRATKEFIDTVIKYLDKKEISNSGYSGDLRPDESLVKKMDDYLSKEEVERIKSLKLDKNKNITADDIGISQEKAQAIINQLGSNSTSI